MTQPNKLFQLLTKLYLVFDLKQPLMENLIFELSKINNTAFPFDGFKTLTDYVHAKSRECGILYAAHKTSITKNSFFVYSCTFGGSTHAKMHQTIKSTYQCPACFKFVFIIKNDIIYFTFSLRDSNLSHNHSINRSFYESHRNILSQHDIEQINQMQSLGVLPGRIRTNINTTVNSNIFYNIRRDMIKQNNYENLSSLIKEISTIEDYAVVVHEKNKCLASVTFIHKKICHELYISDIAFLDDTAGTNIYDCPLEVLAVIDQENFTQILAFGLLENKTIQGFQTFLNDVKNETECEIRAFVIDRLDSQIQAINNIYPMALKVFCKVHIRRDLMNKKILLITTILTLWQEFNLLHLLQIEIMK